ncbi:MAG: ABC transporter permease [Mesorhizobium sp.]|nr:MAG: ABC transporter permease [Mesorhizobium sp.]RWL34197.1 MAG: ABC transporter permease [Mesorhizobium sp.]RWL35613.1 MAG: ABC transporter permease [Mesorhizobium sp.]RWL41023.1 MAG: ABC transporter permease [Mesorhizobium sp.]RWL52211.1 MAG: ABC transporter permease [Mesorhizobium sp.]
MVDAASDNRKTPLAFGSRLGLRQSPAALIGRYGALLVLAGLILYFSLASPYFMNARNMVQIINQAALGCIVAGGLTIVLAGGHFDLSIGYMASLSGVIVANLMAADVPVPVAMGVAIASGVIAGAVNGFLVTKLEIHALVATLGTGSLLVGVNYLLSSGVATSIAGIRPEFMSIAIGNWLGVPRPVYYMVIMSLILWAILSKTDFGRNVRAVGGNVEAAMLSGVPIKRVVTLTFVISGVCAAVTGVLLASTVGSGQPNGGDGYTLTSFAAAFVGSTVLREGQFHVFGTIVGGVTVAAGFNGLALIGVPPFVQYLFQGLLLIAAVALSSAGRRWSRG